MTEFKQFGQARLVRITSGAIAVGLYPFGMLDAQVVVDLPLELAVGMNFVRHISTLASRSDCSHCAGVGFFDATEGRMATPSTEGETVKWSPRYPG